MKKITTFVIAGALMLSSAAAFADELSSSDTVAKGTVQTDSTVQDTQSDKTVLPEDKPETPQKPEGTEQ